MSRVVFFLWISVLETIYLKKFFTGSLPVMKICLRPSSLVVLFSDTLSDASSEVILSISNTQYLANYYFIFTDYTLNSMKTHISFEIGYYIPELCILHCVLTLSFAGKKIHSCVLLDFKLVFPDTDISELWPGHKVPG